MSTQAHYPIRHIDDVLPHIDGRKDFVVAEKDGYTVIDYVFAGEDTFDHPARLEFRGLKFAPDGALLARPLHKFRNIGETPELQPHMLDFSAPHTVMEKLDGSMIHACIVDGEVVFMTRMGRTDVARKAEWHLTSEVRNAARLLLEGDVPATPIFEWTAPDNRIVVQYTESSLTLLAIRRNEDGFYYPHAALADWAQDMCVPVVTHHTPQHNTAEGFLAYARTLIGMEGFVVRFDNGLWVKAKADDYVMKHRAKDSILQEKNILALVLNGGLDDVLPLLDKQDAARAKEYAEAVELGIAEQAHALWCAIADNDNSAGDRKTFATKVVPRIAKELRPLAFQIFDGKDVRAAVRERIAANCNSQSQVDACRALHGARWVA